MLKFGLVKFEATALISLYRALNFSIFRVRVSATQICKFERKNDKTKYCEMIFRVFCFASSQLQAEEAKLSVR